jgi:hypothetical protein
MADVHAPHFLGSIYRVILEYAASFDVEDESEAREHLRRWTETFGLFFPSLWRETLQSIMERPPIAWQYKMPKGSIINDYGFITWEEYQAFVQRDLQFPELDKEFMWHSE